MAMSIDDLVKALDEDARAPHNRCLGLSKQAEEADLAQPAKFFRALIAIETAKQRLYRRRLASLADKTRTNEHYVYPGCGYAQGGSAPEKCPVCETAGGEFERIR